MLTPEFLLVFSLGPTEMVILLVIVLILFSGARLPSLMRVMHDGIRDLQDWMRYYYSSSWQQLYELQRRRRRHERIEVDPKQTVVVLTGLLFFGLLISLGAEKIISEIQTLVSLGV